MKQKSLTLLLLLLVAFAGNSYAQQIKVKNAATCVGYLSEFTIPPFTLPPSTNIERYTFYIGSDTITTTENEYSALFSPGTYSASAKIALSNGTVVNTNTIPFRIVTRPIANFSFANSNTLCNSDSAVCVNNTSVQTAFPITKILLEWGDATGDSIITNVPHVCHNYGFPGAFWIALRVFDSIGCYADTSFPITVNEKIDPLINWNGSVSCSGSSYTFTNNYHKGIKSYSWDFGDGQTYSATSPFTNTQLHHIDSITHTYTADGVFTPSLSITDTNGCSVVQSKHYLNTFSLPANIVTNGKIISSSLPQGPDEQVFCFNPTNNAIYFTPPTNTQFNFQQNWSFDALWNFDDPASTSQNFNSNYDPQHIFMQPGIHIVKLDLSASYRNCIFYDTIELVGPAAKIESQNQGIVIVPWQKNQVSGTDTVDFVNTTIGYGVKNKIRFVWDFNDDYAPVCTSYSVPKAGALLPFNTAKEQYDNSNHYYVSNGITYSGKMNCRWSMDSLPRHRYTNWDTVYSWYIHGKTFPPSWGLFPIPANSDIHFLEVPDPFVFAKGEVVLLQGNISSPNSNYTYKNKDGIFITYNGMTVLPNSTQTFYEYVFYNGVARNYSPGLSAFDSLGKGCLSSDNVTLKFGKPDIHKLKISGKQCSGGGYGSDPNGIIFDLSNLNTTAVLINFDSLADRKDATPCDIDGFVDYQGGVTPGGLTFPPFFATPNFMPMPWTNGAQSKLYYHYGPNAPQNRPAPADSVNGYVTIGIIIGSGCANPPFCTQAQSYSDTLWFHNILQIKTMNARFKVQNGGTLFSKNSKVTVTPDESYQPTIKYDSWIWGDGTMTIDSFRYASDYNLPGNLTNGYFVNGKRRVRYQLTSPDNNSYIVSDSLPFPNGLPGVKLTTDSIIQNNCSVNNPAKSYITKDSAMMVWPLTHRMNKSSYDFSGDKKNPTINSIIHFTGNTKGCFNANAATITVGIIDSIETPTNTFCSGESVNMKGFARYFRCDNAITQLPFDPNHSCATNTYYQSPYDQLNFDTLDFWNLNKNQTATVKYTYLNTATNKTDTVFYEKMYWNFGDGSPLFQGGATTHRYTSSGIYNLSMITRDSMGGWDTCTKQIFIGKPIAKIGFEPQSFPPYLPKTVINCGENAVLIDSSTVTNIGDSIISNYWWLGEQTLPLLWEQINTKQITHKYKSNGLFKVKLVVESQLGCRDTTYANIFVRGPRPDFEVISATSGCPPLTVKLVNNADGKRKFQNPDGTTFPSDTPTMATYFDMGDESPQIITSNRRDTIEYTYTTSGEFSINAYGSDAPIGLQNYCPLSVFPDGFIQAPIVISVRDITTNGIVGKRKVGPSEIWNYSVSRTPDATYSWNITGGAISSNNADFSTVAITWISVDGNYRIVCNKYVNGCMNSDTLWVQVGNPPVGIKETNSTNPNISIFPNPAHNQFTVKLNTITNSPIRVNVYDLVGKNYLTDIIPSGSRLEHTFDIQSLKSGIYLIELISEKERSMYKLLVE